MLKPHERLKAYDDQMRHKYGPAICGTDECGRGSWASCIAAGAVILPEGVSIPGLNDSKLLTSDKREELCQIIKKVALAWSVVFVEADEIDSRGLTWANVAVMQRACQQVGEQIQTPIDLYIVDQSPRFRLHPYVMIPKADSTSLSVAAAAVLAKVTRDAHLVELSKTHPGYGWDENKGYINQQHIDAVNKLGTVPGLHRLSYNVKGVTVKKEVNKNGKKDFTKYIELNFG